MADRKKNRNAQTHFDALFDARRHAADDGTLTNAPAEYIISCWPRQRMNQTQNRYKSTAVQRNSIRNPIAKECGHDGDVRACASQPRRSPPRSRCVSINRSDWWPNSYNNKKRSHTKDKNHCFPIQVNEDIRHIYSVSFGHSRLLNAHGAAAYRAHAIVANGSFQRIN